MTKKHFLLTICLYWALTGLSQPVPTLVSGYRTYFDKAYIDNPGIPRGLLEAVAQTKTHLRHIDPTLEPTSCTGLPPYYGIMGLIKDGKGYFKNTLSVVAQYSDISPDNILQNPANSISAYSAAFSRIKHELKISSAKIEDLIPVLRYLSELPNASEGQQYAQDAELYSILILMNDGNFMSKIGKKPLPVNLGKIFGNNNLKILSGKKVTLSAYGGVVKNPNGNLTYHPIAIGSKLQQQLCLDYPSALWVAASSSNYSSRSGTPISAVTIHTVQGSYAGCISWFQNPSASVSAHYVIRSSDGQVTQMVCEVDKGWHVGTENPYTIGIEHEGYVSNPSWYTTAMYTSSANLCKDIVNSGYGINPLRTGFWPWLATNYYNQTGIPGSCSKIKGHMHFPNQTHTDPGQYWNWDYYYKLINNPPPTTNLTACTGNFYDTGGPGGNYGNDQRNLTVISPTNASSVTITFNSFSLENTWDYMYIYDGNSVWAPLIGYYTGTTNPGTITSSGGAIAFEFRSDCSTTAPGWDATFSCTTSGITPANLLATTPPCSNTNYTATFSWTNSNAGWWLDISTSALFTDYWNKPIDWLTSTTAPAGFQDPFALGALTLQPGIVYYWRIWDGSIWINGSSFTVPYCPDVTPPTTAITNITTWKTSDFTTTFTDNDLGGSGLDLSFYQVLDYNGSEWRANGGNGFYNDNFDIAIHPEWTVATGTWLINGGYINQTDENVNQTNINTGLTQNSSEIYLYHWQANFQAGASVNRRQGLHFFSDNGALPNGGNSYFVYFRADDDKCQIYKVISDVWTLESDTPLVVNENTWYDYKILFNPTSGEIKVYQNDVMAAQWTDLTPHTSGTSMFLRTGNANMLFNDLKVYKARTGSEMVTVGPASTNDVRYQNPNPSTPSCRIKSIVKDNAENWSSLATLNVNIDWTPPSDVAVSDGTGSDVDTVCSLTELTANWSSSSDPNSDVSKYWYSIGTFPGGSNVAGWTDNGLNTSVTHSGLSLTVGQLYYFNIYTVNGAGLVSNTISSDGQSPKVLTINAWVDTNQITLPDSAILFTDSTPGAVSWSWSFPGGSPAASTNQVQTVVYNTAGSYDVSLTVTDANGCSASVSAYSYIIVSDPPPAVPIAAFTSNVTSGCEPLTVNFYDASANSPYSWFWTFQGGDIASSTDTNPTVTYLFPGVYAVTLTVTNSWGGNTLTDTNYITVNPIPVVSVTADVSICQGESTALIASGGNTYLWSTGQIGSTITVAPSATTVYTVTTTSNGCTSTSASVTVNVSIQPSGTITPDQTICFGDSAVITATGGGLYLWSTGDTTASIFVESQTIPTAYSVIISSGACLNADTLYSTLTTMQKPIAGFTAADTVAYLPNNATVFFNNSSTAANGYSWFFGDGNTSTAANPSNTYTDTGIYTVTLVAHSAVCPDDTFTFYDYISVYYSAPAAGFALNNDSICSGDSVIFTNTSANASSYQWIFTGGNPLASTAENPSVKYDSSGTYNVSLTAFGPGGTDSITQMVTIEVVQPPVSGFTTNDTLLILPNTTAAFTNTSSNASGYFWNFGDGNTSTDANPWNIYPGVGIYTVTLIAKNGICPDDTLVVDSLVHVNTGTGVGEFFSAGGGGLGFSIFPNPAKAYITLILNENAQAEAELFDALGRLVLRRAITKKHTVIDCCGQPVGVYSLRVKWRSGSELTKKVVLIGY